MGKQVIKLLLVDDDEDDYIFTRDLLLQVKESDFNLQWVSSYEAAQTAIKSVSYDAYLIDYCLGSHNGLELMQEAIKNGCKTPVIFLTGQTDEGIDLKLIKAGAMDYLVKGQITASLLYRSIRYAIERAQTLEALHHSEDRVRQIDKMDAIGRLAGELAHDFNNLLTIIISYSDMLTMRLEKETPLYRFAEHILKAGEQAALLTQQLLTVSRRQRLQPKVFDLNSAITEMAKVLRRSISKEIKINTIVNSTSAYVNLDAHQIEQVVMHLANNARDAMPYGGKLTIEITNQEITPLSLMVKEGLVPGNYVLLIVSDNGYGMDKDIKSHIFEPFFTTKEKHKATGLGLAISYGIIKQSGGHIEVLSELGKGTTFKIYLPQATAPLQAHEWSTIEVNHHPASETILLVEDEINVREMISYTLKIEGYKVLEACHGWDALRICEEHNGEIDLLVTDVVMPHMNGSEIAKRLMALRPNMKVLYMSGYVDKAIEVMEQDSNFLEKPFTIDMLMHKVRNVLDFSIHN